MLRRPLVAILVLLSVAGCTTAAPTASPGATSSASATSTAAETAEAHSPAPPLEPDSASKIVDAEAAGTIDHDGALVYLLFAALDYNSLPAEYRSSNPAAPEATAILAELSLRLPELPADLQEKVAPFFARPNDPTSVWAKRSATQGRGDGGIVTAVHVAQTDCSSGPFFACIDVPEYPIRLWYDISVGGAAEHANALSAEIVSSGMWTKEKGAMVGHTPCSDEALAHNGGDSRLDVYLISTDTFAFDGRSSSLELPGQSTAQGGAVPQATDACGTIAFLLLAATENTVALKTTLAHELFHAFEFSFKNARERERLWWLEAAAVWSEDLVYPTDETERAWLNSYWSGVAGPEGPLDTYVYGQPPQYAAYIWAFYLRQKVGQTNGSIIGRLWVSSETEDPIDAMAKLDGWPQKWKEFALWNWNAGPPALHGYRDHDEEIPKGALYQLSTCMSEADSCEERSDHSFWSALANGKHTFPVGIDRVSVRYLAGRPDTDVEKLTFDLASVRGQQGIGIQAALWIGDADHPSEIKVEDWSDLAKREICLNEEDVRKVVLVVSNSRIEGTFDGLVNVEGRSSGCTGWRGTMKATMTWNRREGDGSATTIFDGLWAEDPEYGETRCYYALDGECEVYYRPEGTIKWTWDTHQHDFDYVCNETTSGTVSPGNELHPEQQMLVIGPIADGKHKYWGMGNVSGWPDFKCIANVGEGTYAPPGFFSIDESASSSNPGGGGNTCGTQDFVFDANAESFSGSCYQFKYDYNDLLFEWDLHRVGPPPGQ